MKAPSIFGSKNGKPPVDKNPHPKNFDARPPEHRLTDEVTEALKNLNPPMSEREPVDPIDLVLDIVEDNNRKLSLLLAKRDVAGKGIAGIKELVRTLSYGEMIELCGALWKMRNDEVAVTEENLPAILHRFAHSS